jgi:hypothetical protein
MFAVVLALVLSGCSGATDAIAQFDTVTYKSTVFAINGSPLSAATAISTPIAQTVRAQATFDFDVAFDLDAHGVPVLLTQRRVGRPIGSVGHEVGLQILPAAFEDIDAAPRGGWVLDSLLSAPPGTVVGIRSGAATCQFQLSRYIYSKMVIDSVRAATRQIWLTTVTDPNCGFRSFRPGRPSN